MPIFDVVTAESLLKNDAGRSSVALHDDGGAPDPPLGAAPKGLASSVSACRRSIRQCVQMARPPVDHVSAALRRNDVLEPWLTESHYDENYWDGEARSVVERLSDNPTRSEVRSAVAATLTEAFPNGGFRPDFEELLDLIAGEITSG